MRIAPKRKFRVIGSDSQSMWIAGDYIQFNAAKGCVDRKVAETDGYNSMAIYDSVGKCLYSSGLSMSVDRSFAR